MALDAQKALQLSALLAMTAQQFSVNNPGQQQLAQGLLGSAQAGIQAEALKKAKKEQDKENKAGMLGKVGNLFGGTIGGTLAYKAAGGSDSWGSSFTQNVLQNASTAMDTMGYGKASQFAQPDNAAAERPLTETLGKSTIPAPATLPANPVGLYPTSPKNALAARQETPMLPNGAQAIPVTSGMHPSTNNAMNAAQKPVGFGQRLMGGIAQGLGIEQQRRVVRNPDGTVDLY